MKTQRFRVKDMHCLACVLRLESLEDELPGVQRATASYHRQQLEVLYDETRLTAAQIVAAVKAKGYAAEINDQ